ncbi:hypothetical protein A2Y85_02430 [candidate division WOR-3 bacterium RBG_13_43_14]|uniref:Uncharacterized protein n=1 Tax=candidate division WOR-3 bacterium RBG_13_43_14 TaxID=1802590 RepID=A0A1F4UCV0_UNCW3|nr:MAG: hypothetical protein A2Y85_02430 [candidate division WOR-3 bacterium RBG_13_43_14]
MTLYIVHFIPLEKTTDFNRWLFPNKADGGLIPPSRIPVRGRSSLTGFTRFDSISILIARPCRGAKK